mgnify:CR=1 FL=1
MKLQRFSLWLAQHRKQLVWLASTAVVAALAGWQLGNLSLVQQLMSRRLVTVPVAASVRQASSARDTDRIC